MFPLLYSNLVISSFITITGFLAWVTRRVPLAKQELPTLPKHLRSIMTSSVVHCLKSLNVVYCWSLIVFTFFFLFWPFYCLSFFDFLSAGFTYRLHRLNPRGSKFRGLSHLCCNNVLSKQPFSNFPYTVALHFKIWLNFKHSSSSSPSLKLMNTFLSSSSREGGELGGASQVE